MTELAAKSHLKQFGLEVGDAVVTVNGEDFDSIEEFQGLTQQKRDMVWEIVHVRCRHSSVGCF